MTDGPGVHCGTAYRSYADLGARAMKIAGGLQTLGVSPGDRIAIFLRNDIPFLEASAAAVEPLPLVPAMWITGGSRSCGLPSRSSSLEMRSSERSKPFG